MPTFDEERYNMIVSSAFEAAYVDEMEKLAVWQAGARILPWLGRLAPKVLGGASKVVPKAAPAGEAALAAGGKPGLLARFFGRQRHALGLGKKLKPNATPAEIAAHEKHLANINVTGTKPISAFEQQAAATKKVHSKWNIPERVKQLVQGSKYDPTKAVSRQAGALRTQEEAARKMYELGGTTIPGTVKAMATKPLQTMGAGWKSMPKWQKYMMGGFGAMQAKELAEMEGKTPQEKAETIARSAVMAPLWLGTGGLSALPSIGAWMGGEELAVRGAKGIAKGLNPNAPATSTPQLSPEDIQQMRQLPPEGFNQ